MLSKLLYYFAENKMKNNLKIMKKIIISAFMLIVLTFVAKAQDISKNALGFRLGGNYDIPIEVSYQRRLSNISRIELDLGWKRQAFEDFKLSGIYQRFWNLDSHFKLYAGAGGASGSWQKIGNNGEKLIFTYFSAVADVGIEYNLNIPFQLSLDVRPELDVLGDSSNSKDNNTNTNIALGIRYRF